MYCTIGWIMFKVVITIAYPSSHLWLMQSQHLAIPPIKALLALGDQG